MNPPPSRCEPTRAVLPELALGIADGQERGLALEHMAGCAHCLRELEELSAVTDTLIALAPSRPPPAGFESRVLQRLQARQVPTRLRSSRRRARLRLAGATLAAAAAVGISLNLAYAPDRRLASQYRAALRQAHGVYFQSARLHAADGSPAGVVFAYQGSPSWLFYVLDDAYGRGPYKERIVTRSGRTIDLAVFRPVAKSWGVDTPVPVRDIARVTLTRQPHGDEIGAQLPRVQP